MPEREGSTKGRRYFFAGGGTGGHLYPAIAAAEQIKRVEPGADITFLCSERSIDPYVLSRTNFGFIQLPAREFAVRPAGLIRFVAGLIKGYRIAKSAIGDPKIFSGSGGGAVVIGTGGFAAVPAVLAAKRLKVPIAVINVDSVPGGANKVCARFADKIFLQFDDTRGHLAKYSDRIVVSGCPLRSDFGDPDKGKAAGQLGLDANKKTLLITGASSGAQNINNAVAVALSELGEFADAWQVVHLTGRANIEHVKGLYGSVKMEHRIVDYYDDMAGLLGLCDLVVARGGAVSVAEFAAAGCAVICLPYPYHKDRHQYLNAQELVRVGAAVIVEDQRADTQATATQLCRKLRELMGDDDRRGQMKDSAKKAANLNAAGQIAQILMSL